MPTGEMTAHDRILAVYRNQKPDRVPLGIYTRYLPRGAVEARSEPGARDHRLLPRGLDGRPAWHLLPGYQSEIREPTSADYSWQGDQLVERRRFDTPLGSVWQETVQDKGGVAARVSANITSPKKTTIG